MTLNKLVLTDNTDVGTASVAVAYAGESATGTFAIVAADIADAALSGVADSYTAGSFALSPVLTFNGAALAEGTDYTWTVTGGGSTTLASDCAANYDGDYAGENGGTGFPSAWTATYTVEEGVALGGTWADAGKGFGLWESNGFGTEIRRTLPRALRAGDVFSFTIATGDIVSGAGEGAGVCSSGDGEAGFRIWFNGGGERYATSAGETTIGWTTEPISVVLTMTDSLAYAAVLTVAGQESCTLEGTFSEACDTFRAWSWSNKGDDAGKNYDFFVDDLLLQATAEGGSDAYLTTPGGYTLVVAGKGNFTGTQAKAFTVVAGGETVETAILAVSSVRRENGTLSCTLAGDADLTGATAKVYVTSDLTDEDSWAEAEGVTVAIDGANVSVSGLDFGSSPALFLRFGKE